MTVSHPRTALPPRPVPVALPDLRQLETAVAVFDAGTVSAAARQLRISQPAVSMRLHALEAVLGVQVFGRVGRGLQATDRGREVIARARALLHELARIGDPDRIPGTDLEKIRVGTLPSLAAHLLAPAIVRLRSTVSVIVEVEFAVPRELLREQESRQLDLLVATFPEAPPRSRRVALGTLSPTLIVGAGSALASRRTVHAGHLGAFSWVAPPPVDDPLFIRIDRYLRSHGLKQRVAVRVPHVQSQVALVRQSRDLAAIVPAHAARSEGVHALRLGDFGWDATVWAVTRRKSSAIDALIALLRERGSSAG